MSHATQTLHTCDRCGAGVTGPLRTRKQPDGWLTVDAVMPDAEGAPALVAADLCAPCVKALMDWFMVGKAPVAIPQCQRPTKSGNGRCRLAPESITHTRHLEGVTPTDGDHPFQP